MMKNIADQEQRQAALNPKQSFIVQAPAGSGKTELLTQRFLILLAQVKQPEEILAITFTKKSSAEMRARIINALKNAAETPEPEATHAKTTWNLAKSALERNRSAGWNLTENPNRLRIQTIDSFNAYLTRQLPILSNFGAPPEITDDATALYRAAVQEFLMYLEENTDWSNAIAELLLHVDNDLNKVEELLINLLKKRDQWLPYITLNANDPALRQKLETHLANVVIDALINLKKHFPKEHHAELIDLANYAANHLIKENISSQINHCSDLVNLPGISISDKNAWLGIGELFFTKEGQWRKQFNKTIGFPASSSTKNPYERNLFDAMKQRMSDLVMAMQSQTEFMTAMAEFRLTPDCQYKEKQWQLLDALHQVLRIVVAQLKLTFQQKGKIDYIESAQGALAALGTEDAPTDLTLALDYQLQHILIDEFQDTSNSQYRLIEKLTSGWTFNDGRTLFVVGDPMQSIYRFREAEVGYFIRARLMGLNHISLTPLTLSVNFRSVPGIVSWVNQHFPKIFPSVEDIATGAVTYSSSIATLDPTHEAPVTLHSYFNSHEAETADHIVQLVQRLKTEKPEETIAILVRSRTHLAEIIPSLKKVNLPYKAIDIDPLTTRPVIQDLMALTRALLHPADRIAWLSILRAPWCGLLLSDLAIIASDHPNRTIWEQLENTAILNALSLDGQKRLTRFITIIKSKLADRHRFSLRSWLENSWLLLGGAACVSAASDLEDAAAYFQLLEKLDKNDGMPNLDELEEYVSRLFATPNNQADNSLQIMTIHNAKGLEFDTVILPHLERKSPSDDKQLLLWMERPRANENNALLIAPIHATGDDTDSIYEYIKRQQTIKNDHENGRLLYVAATRAKKRLHIYFSMQKENDKIADPASNSLLEKLWNSIRPEIIHQKISGFHKIHFYEPLSSGSMLPVREKKNIHRLKLNWLNPINEKHPIETITYHNKNSGFLLHDHHPKFIGVILHQILQQICLQGSSWWESQLFEQKTIYCKTQLIQLGLLPIHLEMALKTLLNAIQNTLQDPRGQWIIKPHQEAQSELKLTAIIDNQVKSLILDRTFVDESNHRWIIDYKTASPGDGKHLNDFLNAEKIKYAKQLDHYARAIRQIDQRPIHLGLYFPLISGWLAWQFD